VKSIRELAAAVGLVATAMASAPAPPTRDYLVFVASESADSVALIRFGPKGIAVERQRYVGSARNEPAGPHGVGVSPDGAHYFVSIAHGRPYGSLQKFNARTDSLEGSVLLGNFPATVQVSPDGFYAFVSNFNVHGDMVPSSISVVAADQMTEIARIETCIMPHGSRLTADGKKHYSTCMMDDALIEIEVWKMAVSRHFVLTAAKEKGASGPFRRTGAMAHGASGHGTEAPKTGDHSCQPAWAQPSANGARVWVACSRSSEIVEIDAKAWTVIRRIPARPGVYNFALTHDGTRLLTTNKRDQSMSVLDLATGRELARVATTRAIASGIAVSDDDKYAFVTAEGSGRQPGTVDVVDLTTLTKVASIDVGAQAGGIDFWRSEPAPR
jgi:DNA-binding beta-propeller fold protein YncE